MNTIKNKQSWILGILAAGCAIGLARPFVANAEVSDADFKALKEMVQQLNSKVQQLEQNHATDQQTHQKDLQQIQQLSDKLGQVQTQPPAAPAVQPGQTVNSVAGAMQQMPRVPLDEATVNHNFLILGDAEVQYVKTDGQHGGFVNADFAPIFLYRGGENVLFEAGFDFMLQNNAFNTNGSGGYSTTINLSFAQLDYVMNNYMTLCAGNLLLPLGTYQERGAGWLNKIPDQPLSRSLLPGNGIGAELRGALSLDDSGKLFNYAVYGVNGPGSIDSTGNANQLDLNGNVGLNNDGATVANLHGSPVGGGRVSVFLPFKPHYDLELGLSGQTGEWEPSRSHQWTAGVFDGSLHLGPNFELKGEFTKSVYGSDDFGLIRQEGWYTQASYKLAGLNLDLPLINNLELLGRYDSLHGFNVANDTNFRTKRYTAGFIYYLSNTLLFEGDYEFIHSTDDSQPTDQLILQLSYGF